MNQRTLTLALPTTQLPWAASVMHLVCTFSLCACGASGSGPVAPPNLAATTPQAAMPTTAGSAGSSATSTTPTSGPSTSAAAQLPTTSSPQTPSQTQPTAMPPQTTASAGSPGTTAAAGAPASTGSGGTAGSGATMASGDCDRACLVQAMTDYLNALTHNDPSMLKVAPDVRFTENGMQHKLGEGLWQTATGIRANTRQDCADPVGGQVGTQLVVETRSAPTIYSMRMKLVDHLIKEVETVTVTQGTLMGLVPDPVFNQPIDPAKRMKREDVLAVAQSYEKLLETGSAKKAGVKFDPKMVRLENGMQTADAASLMSRETGTGQGDIPSRYPVVDEEYGLVYAVFQFGNTLVPNELFKIMDGQIRALNIVLTSETNDGWD